MLIVSSDMGSRPLGVILTAFRAVFICGDTAAIVPWRIVPMLVSKTLTLCFSPYVQVKVDLYHS